MAVRTRRLHRLPPARDGIRRGAAGNRPRAAGGTRRDAGSRDEGRRVVHEAGGCRTRRDQHQRLRVRVHRSRTQDLMPMAPDRDKFAALLASAQSLPPIVTAVAHPCDSAALLGAMDAMGHGLITPILVGPETRIRAAAEAAGATLDGIEIVSTPHSHASAAAAVALVREGRADALMKGSLHTDELMSAVVDRALGLRTARRISHCFVLDVPSYPELLIITDAAVNIAPNLDEKKDIVQNAIDLGHALGFDAVRVAILSAIETVNPKVPSTVEAAALCKMADRRQITGGVLDGPLAFDNAISLRAAAIKEIESPVAGRANVLVVPDLEAGNMLAKSLTFLAGADAAGIVLGAKVPVMLTSRADSPTSRRVSCAVAVRLVEARRGAPPKSVS
ncbi:MAG: phosphate acetyltransferase [Burkholderiales bacterium]|nr:phosphate acetyltransferase [Burkholderiales bacterium]